MKKLPIGIQTLSTIRNENYVYIDKTKEALNLIENGKYYFLSRPRRFGKSLFLDTLSSIFESKKELFKDLYIYDKYDWSKSYPIIKIDFGNQKAKTEEELKEFINVTLQNVAKKYGVSLIQTTYFLAFKELITALKQKTNSQVVVLIDEYDKPILDNIEDLPLAKAFREILKGFYTIIKGADEDLKFAFLTGVSKFAKTSIFSGLNNLDDISLDKRYSTICGYTQKDLEESFKEYLQDVDMDEVKRWYNGYSWLGESVYNPFDILLFFAKDKEFRAYWFETGTPTFLIKLIREREYYLPKLQELIVGDSLVGSFEIDDIKLESILFQSGYLTIKKVSKDIFGLALYTLGYPNFETQHAFNNLLIESMTSDDRVERQSSIYRSLLTANLQSFKDSIISLFASIPYNNYTKNPLQQYEGYYASVLYAYLASLGIDMSAEDVTSKGRIDLTLKLPNVIYILEFKVDGKEKALQQIKDKNYADKYKSEGKEIWLVGIEFDSESKGVSFVEWERVDL